MTSRATDERSDTVPGEELLLESRGVRIFYQFEGSKVRYRFRGTVVLTDRRLIATYRLLGVRRVTSVIDRSTIGGVELVTTLRLRGAIHHPMPGRRVVRFQARRDRDGRPATVAMVLPTDDAEAWRDQLSR